MAFQLAVRPKRWFAQQACNDRQNQLPHTHLADTMVIRQLSFFAGSARRRQAGAPRFLEGLESQDESRIGRSPAVPAHFSFSARVASQHHIRHGGCTAVFI
jgi:hypothetical protein